MDSKTDKIKGTIITLPKGMVVLEQGGDRELGGTVGRLTADTTVELSRTMDEDDLAAMFVAAKKPELLDTLDGKYTIHGVRLEGAGKNLTKHEDLSDGVINAPERAQMERQKIEDERLAETLAENKKANRAAAKTHSADVERAREKVFAKERLSDAQKEREEEIFAEAKAKHIEDDIKAKAAVADDETLKDDIERATDQEKENETKPDAALEPISPKEALDIPEKLKIAPDKTEIDREREAVEKIGEKNAETAKENKEDGDFNKVMKKDGTHNDVVTSELSKKQAVKNVDEPAKAEPETAKKAADKKEDAKKEADKTTKTTKGK